MKKKKIVTGNLEENCYILYDNNDCVVIDPGDDYSLISEQISKYNLLAILITHYHEDHVGALKDLLNENKVPIYDYKSSNKKYNIKGFDFEIIKTPGHTNDSVSFYFKAEETIFVGDFIFKETIGRTDLPTGNKIEMDKSINMIKKYPKEMIIYPGHGDSTTLEHELKYNYFFD